jgi:hypothetical protein
MMVLLILNKKHEKAVRVIVRLHTRRLKEQVEFLLREARDKEAFDLIVSKAMVEAYIPQGERPAQRPELTLIEDML